ncbi:MAG: hypothetical protein WBC51_05030 [Vicinamibacterales bacterium]
MATPRWAFNLSVPVPESVAARAFLRADSTLALTASIVSKLPASFLLTPLRAELTALGYLPIPTRSR